ncbi:MAG: hypothetical protein JO219_05325 [Candidatus Eremiobacteraeota bacterium]|nr:hypothetical protein [Candidatus Eremiobacteraeota bacterium]
MFSRLEGTLRERREQSVLIDVNGLTYDVMVPGCVMDKLAALQPGSRIALEVFSYIQIDGNRGTTSFVGFTNSIEREFFEALLSVSSIGPKTAVRAFARPMAEIARYIDDDDRASLRKLPGIGDQKAKDIIAKLQGKVARFGLIQGQPAKTMAQPDHADEALEVLLQLQYKRAEAERMIKEAMASDGAIDSAEELLAAVYRNARVHESGAPRSKGRER